MNQQSLDILWNLGFVGVVSFGLTYIVMVLWMKYKKKEIPSTWKMVIQGVFAFLLMFVPLEFQNVFLDHLKVAVGVVASSAAVWQIVKAI